MNSSVKKMLIFATAVIVAAGIGIFQILKSNSDILNKDDGRLQAVSFGQVDSNEISLKSKSGGSTIKSDEYFTVTAENISEEYVQKYMSLGSDMKFTAKKVNDTSVMITPAQPISAESLVTVRLADENGDIVKKWAFQTQDVFKIVSTIPTSGDSWIGTDSGIEIRFSEADIDLESFKNAFSITPNCEGTFKQVGKTVVFIPNDGFDLNKKYTVKIAGTVSSMSGQTLGKTTEIQFNTAKDYENGCFLSNDYELDTFTQDNAPVVKIRINQKLKNKAVNAEVYKFSDFEHFYTQLTASINSGYSLDLSKLQLVSQFETQQNFRNDGYNYDDESYLPFPENLQNGWYAVKLSVTADSGEIYDLIRFVQISPIAFYIAANSSQALVWVNDTTKNAPVEGANVSLLKNDVQHAAVTQSNGTAVINFPTNEATDDRYYNYNTYQNVVRIDCDGQKVAAVTETSQKSVSDAQTDYYAYVYTNREVFKTTDCIKVWGIIKPRKSNAQMPKKATIAFENYIGTFYECTVDVEEDGTFVTEYKYEDLDCYYCEIVLKTDGKLLESKYVTVQDFVKPTYFINAKTEKPLYFAADNGKAKLSFDVTFFDGTPASDLPIKLKSYQENITYKPSLTLDANGHGEMTVQVDTAKCTDWMPNYFSIWLESSANDTSSAESYAEIRMFTRDIMMRSDIKYQQTNSPELTLRLNKINESNVDASADFYDNDFLESIAGEKYNTGVKTKVYLNYYEKVQTGEYYDYIYKKIVKTYDYNYKTKLVKEISQKTVDGAITISGLPLLESGQSYTYEFSCKDTAGRTTTYQAYAYYGSSPAGYSQDARVMDFRIGDTQYVSEFKDGENIEVTLQNQYETFEMPDGAYFISALVQEDFYDIRLCDTEQFTILFDTRNIPNARIVGAYYENGKIYTINQQTLILNTSERKLNIEVTSDKQQYKPGDTANINVKVTDKQGNPVKNASVCVSISDESIFSVMPQYVDVLGGLFESINWGFVLTMTSNNTDTKDLFGEGGGGGNGGSELRDDFADDIFFERLVTNSDGVAELGVQLPDNLTSWRITAIAVTDDLCGGNTKSSVTTKIPMFTNVAFTDTFITGDTVSFGVRTYGESITGTQSIKYLATIKNSNGAAIATKQQTAQAGTDASFTFDSLSAGKYTFEISATAGDLSDAQALNFEVKETASQIRIRREIKPEEINEIQAQKYPLTLMISSKEYMTYNKILNTLLAMPSIREEERAAGMYAYKLNCEMTGEEYSANDLPDVYSEDLYMLARLCMMTPEYVNKTKAIYAFEEALRDVSSSSEQISSAYLGLAALEQPVLNDIRHLLQNNDGSFDTEDLLRLCAAAAIIGDYDFAQNYYSENIAANIINYTLPDGTLTKHYQISQNEPENVEVTALAAITAFVLNNDDADELAGYLIYAKENITGANGGIFYPICELTVYLKYFAPKNNEEVLISYNNGETRVSVSTAKRGTEYVVFSSKEQYKNADIMILSGSPYIEAVYTGSVKDAENIATGTIKINKSYGTVKIGKLTKVTLSVKSDATGHILVKDFIPAGFCYDKNENVYNEKYSIVNGDNKSVTFDIDYENAGEEVVIEYYIHAVLKGTFISEEPIACLTNNNTISIGERKTLSVK